MKSVMRNGQLQRGQTLRTEASNVSEGREFTLIQFHQSALTFHFLLFLLAEQAEAFLLLLLLVLLSLPRTRLSGKSHGGRQRLSAPSDWRARVTALNIGAIRGGSVQNGLDPGAHLLLRG